VHPPPSPARTDFTLITECTPESSGCNSVYSVASADYFSKWVFLQCVHQHIKDALCAHDAGPAWHSHLPWVLLGLRLMPKEDSAVSSAELVTGFPLILPGQLLHVPYPPPVDMLAPPMWPADSLPARLARAEHVEHVGSGGQKKPLAAPYASPAPEE
jgi:hypothetical protein